ncbi:asparagine synthetase B family protein [Qipengyuania nanhaisediminis]|uniref:asparagine synthetase B family protein n=1 Tax=Qipengyuania nanhaisediminis TaxID=604088 RepID=UPI0038B3EFA6
MSVIGAIFEIGGTSQAMVDAMEQSLRAVPHDQAAQWREGPMALACAIRHTTGESHDAAQPVTTANGKFAGVFAGHLLNHEELSRELETCGVALRNASDAEIALRGYETWGAGIAERLRGEFSLIIADMARQRLFVARDHLGFVPLYFRKEKGRLIVASDLRTIAALSETPLEPDRSYLAQVIANRWYLREETAWRGVRRVVRAHWMTFDGARIAKQRYWEPPTEVTIRYKNERDYVEHYRELLFDCVRRSTRCDRPVGIAVSGGLDSSAIFCVADRLEQDGLLLAPGFAGYSLAAQQGNAFELPYARAAAAHVGRELTEVPLFDPDIDWYTADAAWHRDIPIPSNGAMMLDMERRVVEDGSRVLINGSGGDEWLQGTTQYYREFIAESDLAGIGEALARDAKAMGWPRALREMARQTIAELTPDAIRRPIRKRLRAKRRLGRNAIGWLAPQWRNMLVEAEEAYEAEMPDNGVHWAKRNLATSPFSDLTHGLMRRQRTLIGLESRHPMLSRDFIEFSLRTPAHIKRKGAVSKAIHRESMQGILPQVILDRTSKANFTNTKIDMQFADYVRAHANDHLGTMCDREGLLEVLAVDYSAPEGDLWAWEIWGLYASAAFLYQCKRVNEINPATGVQQDRT